MEKKVDGRDRQDIKDQSCHSGLSGEFNNGYRQDVKAVKYFWDGVILKDLTP
jgi:hypothetical protein